MIKLKQVTTYHGSAFLVFEFSVEGLPDQTVEISASDIIGRCKAARALLGRRLTLQDLREIIVSIINELREGKTPFMQRFDYDQFIGVDLEGEG